MSIPTPIKIILGKTENVYSHCLHAALPAAIRSDSLTLEFRYWVEFCYSYSNGD